MCLPVKTTAEILLNLKAEVTIVWSIFCKSCELFIGYGYMLSEQQTHGQRRFDFKRKKYSFPSPHPLHAILMFELPTEHNKHPNFEWGGGGGRTGEGCRLFCSLKLPYLSTMSQKFCRRLQSEKSNISLTTSRSLSVMTLGLTQLPLRLIDR